MSPARSEAVSRGARQVSAIPAWWRSEMGSSSPARRKREKHAAPQACLAFPPKRRQRWLPSHLNLCSPARAARIESSLKSRIAPPLVPAHEASFKSDGADWHRPYNQGEMGQNDALWWQHLAVKYAAIPPSQSISVSAAGTSWPQSQVCHERQHKSS